MATTRLFLALWPDPKQLTQLKKNITDITVKIKGQLIRSDNWHLTLAFIGDADIQSQRCLSQHIKQIKCAAFTLKFDHLLCLPEAKIQYYGINSQVNITPLMTLVSACRNSQIKCGFNTELRDFLPHISIAKKVVATTAVINAPSFEWRVTEFVLVASQLTPRGSIYTVLDRIACGD